MPLSETISAVNDAPVNTVPIGPLTVNAGADLSITGLSISDVDAGNANTITTTLSVEHGTLHGLLVGGPVATAITLSGTVAQINALLSTPGGLFYHADNGFSGPDTLTVTTNDGGATGIDPGLSGDPTSEQDTDTVAINVNAVGNNPPETNAGSGSDNEDTTIAVSLSGSDSDGTVASFRIENLPANGVLYSDAEHTMPVTTGGGGVPAVNNAATVYFVPAANFNGSANFQYVAIDNLGAVDDTSATASITVSAVNDAPVASGSATLAAINEDTAAPAARR